MQSEVNLQMMNQFSKKERKKKKRLKTVFQLDICISDLSIRSLLSGYICDFFFWQEKLKVMTPQTVDLVCISYTVQQLS